MVTTEALKALGANTEEGIRRCVNSEDFYLRMVNKTLTDGRVDEQLQLLQTMLAIGDQEEAFAAAHALKGVLTNLSLDNISVPVVEITEGLRVKKEMDYTPYLTRALAEWAKLKVLV